MEKALQEEWIMFGLLKNVVEYANSFPLNYGRVINIYTEYYCPLIFSKKEFEESNIIYSYIGNCKLEIEIIMVCMHLSNEATEYNYSVYLQIMEKLLVIHTKLIIHFTSFSSIIYNNDPK